MKLRHVTAAGIAAAAGALVLASPAAADTKTTYQTNGANIRAEAHGTSTVVGRGYKGESITIKCYRYGPDERGGSVQDYWIFHTNESNGKQGWTAGSNVSGIINRLPKCRSI